MRLLVTGGAGFIGSNFIEQILASSSVNEVTNVDNLSYGSHPLNLKNIENDAHYRFVKGDITDSPLVKRLVGKVDAVVNFAANSHVDRSIADPSPFFRSNVEGTFTLLEAIRQSNHTVRLLHVSTDEVYGDIIDGSFREEDRLKPSSPYSASKAASDLFCLAYHRTYGLNVVVTRCTNNFGPRQFPEKLIPKTIVRAKLNLPIPIYGTGENVRDWIYVIDHCQAISSALKSGKPGEVYNVAGNNELTNLAIVKKILGLMGKPERLIEFVDDRPGHDVRYSIDSTKAKQELGWQPTHDFELALGNTIRWYLENEAWWKSVSSSDVLNATPWRVK